MSDGLRGKGPVLVAVLWTETIISGLFIGLRWFTRQYISGSVGWDDWLLWITWVFMTAFAAICTAAAHYGMGVHATQLTPYQEMMGVELLLCGQFTIAIAMGISKCAVAVFLMRIVVKKWHIAVLWFWIITILGLSFFLAIAVFAQCSPVESLWDTNVKGDCVLNLTIIAKIMCAWSAAMDFFLALFPWYILWNLNMKRKERITICISLSLGVFAGICGVIRTTGLDALSQTSDYLYATTDSVMWTHSEITTTIICVCIPACRPLYSRLTGGSSFDRNGYQNHGYSNGYSKNPHSNHSRSKTLNDDIDLRYMTPADKSYGVHASKASQKEDGDSDRSILGEHKDQIHRVREIRVEYEDGLSATSTKQHV